jgi:hypothetical protein
MDKGTMVKRLLDKLFVAEDRIEQLEKNIACKDCVNVINAAYDKANKIDGILSQIHYDIIQIDSGREGKDLIEYPINDNNNDCLILKYYADSKEYDLLAVANSFEEYPIIALENYDYTIKLIDSLRDILCIVFGL